MPSPLGSVQADVRVAARRSSAVEFHREQGPESLKDRGGHGLALDGKASVVAVRGPRRPREFLRLEARPLAPGDPRVNLRRRQRGPGRDDRRALAIVGERRDLRLQRRAEARRVLGARRQNWRVRWQLLGGARRRGEPRGRRGRRRGGGAAFLAAHYYLFYSSFATTSPRLQRSIGARCASTVTRGRSVPCRC